MLGRASGDAVFVLVGDAEGHKDVASVVWTGERGMAMFSGLAIERPPAPGIYAMEATGVVVPEGGARISGARLAPRRRTTSIAAPKVGEALGGVEVGPADLSWAEEVGRTGNLALRWYWNGATALGNYATLPLQCEDATMTGEWVIGPGLWRLLRRVMWRGRLVIVISTPAFACADKHWFHSTGPRGFVHVRR